MKNAMLLLAALILSIPTVQAGLKVIADLGGEDTAPWYEGINRQPLPASPSAMQPIPQGESAMLPVSTPELSPGPVTERLLQLPGIGALFLVGDDDVSTRWLRANAERLAQQNAAGLIVNVTSMDGVNRLRALVPGVPMVPASGSQLAGRLQIEHYPVFISASGLSQRVGVRPDE